MAAQLKLDKSAVETAIKFIEEKKKNGEVIIFLSEIRTLFFNSRQKSPSIGYVIRELISRGKIKKFNSKSYIIC